MSRTKSVMYSLQESPFGNFAQLCIKSDDGKNSLSVLPAFGACLLDLQLGGHRVLDGYDTVNEMISYRWMKSGLLFPFANRLKNGTYIWNNDTYYFPINDAITGNALHGFGMDIPFEVIQTHIYEREAGIICRCEYNGEWAAYPFPFTLEVHYYLQAETVFHMKMRFYNDGATAIPVSLGWHPFFRLGN
ncbi:MAG TPA: aldose 1-epimerase, partial [Phaeodactylibacter sp.]|nr:aldose 1-epimerase [Phaeodactylibacter sp.]